MLQLEMFMIQINSKDKILQATIDATLGGFEDADNDGYSSLEEIQGLWSKIKAELEKIEPKEVKEFDTFKTAYLADKMNSSQPGAFMKAATTFANDHPEINKSLFLEIARDASTKLPPR